MGSFYLSSSTDLSYNDVDFSYEIEHLEVNHLKQVIMGIAMP